MGGMVGPGYKEVIKGYPKKSRPKPLMLLALADKPCICIPIKVYLNPGAHVSLSRRNVSASRRFGISIPIKCISIPINLPPLDLWF